MTYTLTISSQGQMIIPSGLRKDPDLNIKPQSKVEARKVKMGSRHVIVIEPPTESWVDRVAGTATGMYGDVEKYIENERNSWDR